MDYYQKALALNDETIMHRRYLHQNAEIGMELPKTCAYVTSQLRKFGLDPRPCGKGITATIGHGGKVLLLRADMDALPMAEKSGLPFACPTGTEAHTCGHDLHTAMLLTAAKMLKENEANLQGTVKLMFQPGEEIFKGSTAMIADGILEHPSVDAAMAFHVASGKLPIGTFSYNRDTVSMFSVDGFKITIHGQGAHGAYPHLSIDPINISVHIHLALQSLIARECNPNNACILTIGKFQAGNAANIIPESALLEGTIRCNNEESRGLLVQRMKEVVTKTAEMYGGRADIEMISEIPTLQSNPTLTDEMVGYINALPIPQLNGISGICASASEDFALIARKVPSTFLSLSAGYPDARGNYTAHNPHVQFNEEVLPIGAAFFAHCADCWLNAHA